MKPERTEPIPMKAGDKRVMVNGEPVQVDFRIISEELYQELSQSSPVESKWVSVKERLPEPGLEVLVWSGRYGRTFATLAGENKYGNFWKYAGDPIVTFNAPTHWQPLPELPIEETKEK